jgi:hypothetical protein
MTAMVDPASRILTRISDAELNRRWKAVRQMMKQRGLDAVIMQNTNDWLGGYVKWLPTFRPTMAIRAPWFFTPMPR